MKQLLLISTLLFAGTSFADHRRLEDSVKAIGDQLGTLHFLVEAKITTAGRHEARDLQRLAESAHHLEEYLHKTVADFRRTGDREELHEDFHHVERDFERVLGELDHQHDPVFDAAGQILEVLWGYAVAAAAQAPDRNAPTAVCQVHHSSALFPTTTVSCQNITGDVASYRVSFSSNLGGGVRSVSGVVANGSFSHKIGRIGARNNSYKIELINSNGQAYEMTFSED